MLFDLDDDPATGLRDRPMFGRDGIQLFLPYWLVFAVASAAFHVFVLALALILPSMLPARTLETIELRREAEEARAREADSQRFVFVQPRAEFEARRPPVAPQLSDRDRSAQTIERAPNPTNSLPFSRGNTAEMVDAPGSKAAPQPQTQAPSEPAEAPGERGQSGSPESQPGEQASSLLPRMTGPSLRSSDTSGNSGSGGSLGDAMRNVQRYYGAEQLFDNSQGGGQFGSAIQFDTKGVEFGPWIRRFIAQIKRNWFVPYAAMSLRGHVVVTFNVHKDGRITDVTVVGPSGVDAFNNSSFNAITASNPTQPLPPEYPSDQAFFTVTFFYNETPPR
jgi:TonB family protein